MSKTPVFLSWSGDRSRAVATALRDWIPLVLERAEPWHSDTIDAGRRWNGDIASRLRACNLGIICVTPENREKPWLLFEAGALSKSLEDARVMTYLFDLAPEEITSPLADFQAKSADKAGTLDVVRSINSVLAEPREDSVLLKVFDSCWPMLSEQLAAVPRAPGKAPKKRDSDEVLAEILATVRELRRGPAPPRPTNWAMDFVPRQAFDFYDRKDVPALDSRTQFLVRYDATARQIRLAGAMEVLEQEVKLNDEKIAVRSVLGCTVETDENLRMLIEERHRLEAALRTLQVQFHDPTVPLKP